MWPALYTFWLRTNLNSVCFPFRNCTKFNNKFMITQDIGLVNYKILYFVLGNKKGRYSIYCISRLFLASPWFIFLRVFFLWTPCRCRFDRNDIRIAGTESDKPKHLVYAFFMEIISDIVLIRMGAGKFCPGVSHREESAAMVTFWAFYGLFLVFH